MLQDLFYTNTLLLTDEAKNHIRKVIRTHLGFEDNIIIPCFAAINADDPAVQAKTKIIAENTLDVLKECIAELSAANQNAIESNQTAGKKEKNTHLALAILGAFLWLISIMTMIALSYVSLFTIPAIMACIFSAASIASFGAYQAYHRLMWDNYHRRLDVVTPCAPLPEFELIDRIPKLRNSPEFYTEVTSQRRDVFDHLNVCCANLEEFFGSVMGIGFISIPNLAVRNKKDNHNSYTRFLKRLENNIEDKKTNPPAFSNSDQNRRFYFTNKIITNTLDPKKSRADSSFAHYHNMGKSALQLLEKRVARDNQEPLRRLSLRTVADVARTLHQIQQSNKKIDKRLPDLSPLPPEIWLKIAEYSISHVQLSEEKKTAALHLFFNRPKQAKLQEVDQMLQENSPVVLSIS